MFRLVYVCIVCLTLLSEVYNTDFDWDKYMPAGQGSPVIEYVYYSQPATWNDARSTCMEIGGDLAKLDSEQTIEVILETVRETHSDLNFSDYWVGLTEKNMGWILWASDCSALTYLDNYESSSGDGDDKLCFYISANSHKGFHTECNTLKPFMCERKLNEQCSSLIGLIDAVTSMSLSTDNQTCADRCVQDLRCVASLFVSTFRCFVIYETGTIVTGSLADIVLKAKSCIRVSLNETSTATVTNEELIPEMDCYTGPYIQVHLTVYDSLNETTTSQTSSTTVPQETTQSLQAETTTVTTKTKKPKKTVDPITSSLKTTTTAEYVTSSALPFFTSSCLGQNISSPVTLETDSGTAYVCHEVKEQVNLTINQIEEKAFEISKNLSIPAKATSAYIRRLKSVEDKRTSSVVMGTVGIICVIIPVVLLLLSDLKLLYRYIQQW